MGSGPACALASKHKAVAGLVLLSPYTSLKEATRTYLGSIAAMFVRERFDNLKAIRDVRCPTLLIHGQQDNIIPESHAIELHSNCGGPSKLILPKSMTHNDYNVLRDLVKPIEQFFGESNILMTISTKPNLNLVEVLWQQPPPVILKNTDKISLTLLQQMTKRETLKQKIENYEVLEEGTVAEIN